LGGCPQIVIAPGSAFFYGIHRDELVMAVLRPEWVARADQPKA
jgi:hypothetical protein